MTANNTHPVDCPTCAALRTAPFIEDVADRFGMRVVSVRRHANRHGVDLTRFDVCWPCLEIRWALDYRAVGTVPELAARVGMTVESLRVHARRHGVQIPAHLERVPV